MKWLSRTLAILGLGTLIFFGCAQSIEPQQNPAPPGPVKAVPDKLDWQTNWNKMVTEARKEGELLIYAEPGPETAALLSQALDSKFGIKVSFVAGRGAELSKKIIAERQAGLYLGDGLISGGSTTLVTLRPLGILDPISPALVLPEVNDPNVWLRGTIPFLDKETRVVALISSVNRYITYNTDLVKPDQLTSYRDLLRPEWKGKIVMLDPTNSGAGSAFPAVLAQIWGVDQAKEYLRQLVKQDLILTRDKRQLIEWVARGKYPISLATAVEDVANFKKMGAPLAQAKVAEGGLRATGGSALSLINNRPHPNAAAVFANWILSQEGQMTFSKGSGNPTQRKDVLTEGIDPLFFVEPGEKINDDNEEFYLLQGQLSSFILETFNALH